MKAAGWMFYGIGLMGICLIGIVATSAEENTPPFQSVSEAMTWLEKTSTRMIHDSRRVMPNGVAAFPPQVGIGYEAFWLRDYAYMLDGNVDAFTEKELKDACRFFIGGIRSDGAGVDCIKFDGTPIYTPGFGSMGENPVADGSPFTVDVAWHTWRKTQDREFLHEIIDSLTQTMHACPRDPQNGLVFIDPTREYDRCPYGFTDTVRKTGDEFFSSLLFVQAANHLAAMLQAIDRQTDAEEWTKDASQTAEAIRSVFWDAKIGLFRAATMQCQEPDIWGSAFAVYLEIANPEQTAQIAGYFREHLPEIVQRGQLRHTPGGTYWEKAGARDQYQNGGYWATPMGWFIYTLNRLDPQLADRIALEYINAMREMNAPEWFFGDHIQLPGYNSSTALPLSGLRKMLAEREER